MFKNFKMQKTEEHKARSKWNPMVEHAEEKLEGDEKWLDEVLDRTGGIAINHQQHDPNENLVLGEDLDAEIT